MALIVGVRHTKALACIMCGYIAKPKDHKGRGNYRKKNKRGSLWSDLASHVREKHSALIRKIASWAVASSPIEQEQESLENGIGYEPAVTTFRSRRNHDS